MTRWAVTTNASDTVDGAGDEHHERERCNEEQCGNHECLCLVHFTPLLAIPLHAGLPFLDGTGRSESGR